MSTHDEVSKLKRAVGYAIAEYKQQQQLTIIPQRTIKSYCTARSSVEMNWDAEEAEYYTDVMLRRVNAYPKWEKDERVHIYKGRVKPRKRA